MTEDEAREKWCPHVRISAIDARPVTSGGRAHAGDLLGSGQPSYNRQFIQEYPSHQKLSGDNKHTRVNMVPSHCRCIADDCMMWMPEWNHEGFTLGECGLKARKPTP
jgi:hypothetical protein